MTQQPPHGQGNDISGVDNWVEEGGPLEPQDFDDLEGARDSGESAPAAGAGAGEEPTGDRAEQQLAQQLTERTADLQRLQAEYANYRKRVERDRQLVAENATYQALVPIIDVLDTIDRAREHNDLDAGFQAVADQLERSVAASGLIRFGAVGDAFDPSLHEALSHLGAEDGIEVTTVKVVAKAGYRIGERVVRAAQVLVVDPA